MEDQYGKVKSGGLKLKGEKKHKKHKKHKKRSHSDERGEGGDAKKSKKDQAEDCRLHGGWWVAEKYHEITGPVALQFSNGCYIKAMDNGKFVLGAPHGEGEPPCPEEILMAMRCGEGKFSLKSGFDRFIRLNKLGHLLGASEAVGGLEQFEAVFEDGKCAVVGANGRFMSADEDDLIVCNKQSVGPGEVIRIRSCKEKEDVNKKEVPIEEQGTVADVELKFTKKFMKFQDHKYKARLDYESQGTILHAKDQGNLHEVLLDRREKIKSDRMCK